MRRLLIVLPFVFACSKPPAGSPEPVPPSAIAVPPQDAPAIVDASPEPAPCAGFETCLAMVGDVEIPYSRFAEIYDLKVHKYASRGREIPATASRRYRKAISERLIYHEMLAQEASARGLTYDPAALEERDNIQRRGIRDWTKHLERRGETDGSLRAMYVAELLEQAILSHEGELDITDEEVRRDYEKVRSNWRSDRPQVRASHILVPLRPAGVSPRTQATLAQTKQWEAEAKAKAEAIHDQVTRPGEDFAAIAKERSTGPSAAKGGDIGIFTANRMAQEFSRAAFRMKVGDVSKPVRTKFGYHIIKLTGSWPAGELPIDALEDQIRDRLRLRKLHEGRRLLKDRLRAKYKVLDNMKPTLGPDHRPSVEPDEGQPLPPLARVMR